MIILTDTEKAFNKIQHLLMKKQEKEGSYLNIMNALDDKPKVNIMLNGGKPKVFPLKLGTRQ